VSSSSLCLVSHKKAFLLLGLILALHPKGKLTHSLPPLSLFFPPAYSRKAKSLISALRPTPSPLILEVDRRPDAAPLKNLLGHLTGRSTFPNVSLNFEPLGGGDDIALLAAEGGLANVLKDKGMKMGRLGGAM
jgi:glutaredoxin